MTTYLFTTLPSNDLGLLTRSLPVSAELAGQGHNVAFCSPETDPLPETADVTYIGPILWQKPGAKLPEWVDDLSREKPVIWAYSANPRYASVVSSPVDFVLPTGEGWRKKRVEIDELRAKIGTVLSDRSYTANARRTGERLRTYGGASEAARLITGLR